MKLNLMCGQRIMPGYLNLDMQELEGVDMVYLVDPFRPKLPFKDDTMDHVYWNNGPEHILNVNAIIQELWRVSQDGADWYLLTPGWKDPNSWADPTHFSHWGAKMLDFYTAEGFDHRRYPPALLSYRLNGDDEHGLEFFVTVHKPSALGRGYTVISDPSGHRV